MFVKLFLRFFASHENVNRSAFTTNDFFSAGNVQAVKLIANRRIYECSFYVLHVWYAFSLTRIFATDRPTDVEEKRKKKGKKNTKYRKVDVFFTRLLVNRVDNFGRHSTESIKCFSITIAVTTPTEKAISGDNRILLDVGVVLRFCIEDCLDYISKLIRSKERNL